MLHRAFSSVSMARKVAGSSALSAASTAHASGWVGALAGWLAGSWVGGWPGWLYLPVNITPSKRDSVRFGSRGVLSIQSAKYEDSWPWRILTLQVFSSVNGGRLKEPVQPLTSTPPHLSARAATQAERERSSGHPAKITTWAGRAGICNLASPTLKGSLLSPSLVTSPLS